MSLDSDSWVLFAQPCRSGPHVSGRGPVSARLDRPVSSGWLMTSSVVMAPNRRRARCHRADRQASSRSPHAGPSRHTRSRREAADLCLPNEGAAQTGPPHSLRWRHRAAHRCVSLRSRYRPPVDQRRRECRGCESPRRSGASLRGRGIPGSARWKPVAQTRDSDCASSNSVLIRTPPTRTGRASRRRRVTSSHWHNFEPSIAARHWSTALTVEQVSGATRTVPPVRQNRGSR